MAEKHKIDYHAAYYVALQVDLLEYLPVLQFEREHQLNTEPLRIDAVVVKKEPGVEIKVNFAEHFLGHNIVEFKSPTDYLSVSDFFKTVGYACIYQSVAKVSYSDVTVTIICDSKPMAVLAELESAKQFHTEEKYPGIYIVHGTVFPTRIMAGNCLPPENDLWLTGLREDISIERLDRMFSSDFKAHEKIDTRAYLYNIIELIKRSNRKDVDYVEIDYGEALLDLIEEYGWDKKLREKVISQTKRNIIAIFKATKNNTPLEQLINETGMSIEEIKSFQAEILSV